MAGAEIVTEIDAGIDDEVELERKRKAGSPVDDTVLKRHNSASDLRLLKQPATFTEMMLKSLNDETCAKELAPVMICMVSPAIQLCMDRAVEKIQTSVNTLIESNRELKDIVVNQTKIISTQEKLIADQKEKIEENAAQINNMQTDMSQFKKELGQLKLHVNDMDQYGRRNSVRLINFKSIV